MSRLDDNEEGRKLKKAFFAEAMQLTAQQLAQLAYVTVVGHGEDGAAESHLDKVIDWANGVVVDRTLLSLALKGKIAIKVDDDGSVMFSHSDVDIICPKLSSPRVTGDFDPVDLENIEGLPGKEQDD